MKFKTILSILGLLLLVVILALGQETTAAQSGGIYDLAWNTVAGGGGTSAASVYSISGTAGQFQAGALNGGSFTLVGGFWVDGDAAGVYRVYLPLVIKP